VLDRPGKMVVMKSMGVWAEPWLWAPSTRTFSPLGKESSGKHFRGDPPTQLEMRTRRVR